MANDLKTNHRYDMSQAPQKEKWDPRQSVVRKRDDERMLRPHGQNGSTIRIGKSWFHVDGWVQTCQVEKNCNKWFEIKISIVEETHRDHLNIMRPQFVSVFLERTQWMIL